jgi:tetratricopeptide (TPR) repeat protein
MSLTPPNELQESIRAMAGKWEDAEWDLTSDECRKKLLDIQSLIDEPYQMMECKVNLFFEQGRLFVILEEHEDAVISFDKSLQLKQDNDETWVVRGIALGDLGRYEAAIASFDKSLQLKPDNYGVWQSRGKFLFDLGCYEEAITSYDKALQLKPNLDFAFYNKARCYSLLANTEAAIENLSHAIDETGSLDRLWQALAKTDSSFNFIRENEHFQAFLT